MRLVKSILFVTGLLTITCVVRFIIFHNTEKIDFGTLGKINIVAKHKLNPNIAVFGSSVARKGISPVVIEENTGKSTYNIGIDGNSIIQYNGVLKEFISYTEADYIVIAGTFDEFSSRSAFYELSNYVPNLNNDNIANGLKHIDKVLIWKLKYIPFYDLIVLDYAFYNYFFAELLGKQHERHEDEIKGFLPVMRDFSGKTIEGTITAPIDRNVLAIYRDLISEANKKGIKVILVLAPIYSATQEKIINLSEVKQNYKALAKDNIFIDLSSLPMCSDKSMFYDNLHVNVKGAKFISELIAESI
jgi:hypothetical protein